MCSFFETPIYYSVNDCVPRGNRFSGLYVRYLETVWKQQMNPHTVMYISVNHIHRLKLYIGDYHYIELRVSIH